MTYVEYKTSIQRHLKKSSSGATWQELRDTLKLPCARPCPEWTRKLENELGLLRREGSGRSLVWTLHSTSTPEAHV